MTQIREQLHLIQAAQEDRDKALKAEFKKFKTHYGHEVAML